MCWQCNHKLDQQKEELKRVSLSPMRDSYKKLKIMLSAVYFAYKRSSIITGYAEKHFRNLPFCYKRFLKSFVCNDIPILDKTNQLDESQVGIMRLLLQCFTSVRKLILRKP